MNLSVEQRLVRRTRLAKDVFTEADQIARSLKVLGNRERLRLLCFLAESPRTVTELTACCGLSLSGVSQALKRMRQERVLDSRREGHFVKYHIADKNVLSLVRRLEEIFSISIQ